MSRLLAAINLALDDLRRHPLRTSLSTLGIIMGSASLTAVLALGDGAEAFARQSIEREGWNDISLSPVTSRTVDGLAVPVADFPLFDSTTVATLAGRLEGMASVHAAVEGTGLLGMPAAPDRAVRVIGRVDMPTPPQAVADIAEGRFLTVDEATSGAAVGVIGHRLAQALREAGVPGGRLHESLIMGGRPLTIVGILRPRDAERVLLLQVPLDLADSLMTPAVHARPRQISVQVSRVEAVDSAKAIVSQYANQQVGWKDRVVVSALGRERLDQVARGILTFKLLMGAFTAISLLVGGIGIMNVLLASILERTREIGVRKSVGARRRDILWQFLVESVVVTSMGAMAGVGLGMAGAFIATAVIRAQSQALVYAAWSWQTAALAGGVATVIGLAAGLYPALRASRLSPMEAIQRE